MAGAALADAYQRHSGEAEAGVGEPQGPAGDVFRLTCSSCGAVAAARSARPCAECGGSAVRAESMDAITRQLETARADIEGLLDGIHRHLEMLGTSLHGADAGTSRRVVTLLPDDDRLAG